MQSFDRRLLQKSIKIFKLVGCYTIFKDSNGILGPTVFEVRMREMNLLVGCIMAIVFCAPNQNFIYQKYEMGFGCWDMDLLAGPLQGVGQGLG